MSGIKRNLIEEDNSSILIDFDRYLKGINFDILQNNNLKDKIMLNITRVKYTEMKPVTLESLINKIKDDIKKLQGNNTTKKLKISSPTLLSGSSNLSSSPIQDKAQKEAEEYIKEHWEEEGGILDDLEKYGIGKYTEDDIDLGMNNLIDFEKYRHKRIKERYTDKQLKKTVDKISKSFIIKGNNNNCKSQSIIDYLCFIEHNPSFALPTLLWLDTFHDFKHERLSKDIRADGETVKIDRNKILDYLCYRIYGKHWAGIEYEGIIEDCVYIGHEYNFDKMYQNSFFMFNIGSDKKPIITGFHKDVEHTVLRPLVQQQVVFKGEYDTQLKVAKLLYNVSNVFIANSGGWEEEFLNAYIIHNFKFKKEMGGSQLNILEQLKDISWSEISEDRVQYYAKDVDEGSGNFLKGDLVVIPASLFDANKSNSSKKSEDFVPIPTTKIPLCNGYDFIYSFEDNIINDFKTCNLTLKYSNENNIYSLCSQGEPVINCSTTSSSNLTIEQVKSISKNIKQTDLYTSNISNNIKNEFNELELTIETNYFGVNNCVKIPENTQGMSPGNIVDIIIGLLYRDFFNSGIRNTKKSHNSLSPISCKVLDFWVALKRIGDFGQILQCKQLNIPLFTDDSMQILISIAACSSIIFTIDNFKVLYYKGDIDSFVCADISTTKGELNEFNLQRDCNVYRINPNYKNIINEKFKENKIIKDKFTNLKNSAKNVISAKFDVSGLITNIRQNCKVDIEQNKPKITVNPPGKGFTSSSQQEQTFSLSSNSSLLNPSSTKSFNNPNNNNQTSISSSSSQPQNPFSMYVPQFAQKSQAKQEEQKSN